MIIEARAARWTECNKSNQRNDKDSLINALEAAAAKADSDAAKVEELNKNQHYFLPLLKMLGEQKGYKFVNIVDPFEDDEMMRGKMIKIIKIVKIN